MNVAVTSTAITIMTVTIMSVARVGRFALKSGDDV